MNYKGFWTNLKTSLIFGSEYWFMTYDICSLSLQGFNESRGIEVVEERHFTALGKAETAGFWLP